MVKNLRLLSVALLVLVSQAYGQVKLPRLISNGMILQRDRPVRVWGWASNGETVQMHFNGRDFKSIADANGNWEIMIPPQRAGGPHRLVFKASNEVVVEDVLFGDVWLCSGQSNMELTMDRVKDVYPTEIAQSENRSIRQFLVPDQYDFTKQHNDVSFGEWKTAEPKNILGFSAVAYFFAKEVNARYNVPIGLINAALGGSPVEAWMSEGSLAKFPDVFAEYKKFQDDNLIKTIESEDQARSRAWYAELNVKDQGLTSKPKWSAEKLDDKQWGEMELPGFWADRGFKAMNGSVWFRKTVEVPASLAGKDVRLWMGRIVDQDSVFVNGKFVGTTGYQYPPRKYNVPAGLLRAGKNTIAIRVINSGGKGGFVPDKPYYIFADNDTVSLEGIWKYKAGAEMPPIGPSTAIRWKPVGLFNRMINPLVKYSIKGALWYQGESNADRYQNYTELLSTMITDWRKQWKQGDFPFIFVQLANFMETTKDPVESNWAGLREAQRKTLTVPNTGMAVITDLGEWNDIHPLNKKDVGMRLALLARKLAYGEGTLTASGPAPRDAKARGSETVITFDNVGGGLMAKGGEPLKGFAISMDGKNFQWAKARIEGNSIVVSTAVATGQVIIRYAWADNPADANLYNKDGLPATPFEIKRAE
jgi:sialate O-acetylesterase